MYRQNEKSLEEAWTLEPSVEGTRWVPLCELQEVQKLWEAMKTCFDELQSPMKERLEGLKKLLQI